tara:strand:- start:2724 stop:3137 length:414 start_codon:yes stop_codon:yes gene_type:complete
MIGLIVSGLSKAVGGYFENKGKESIAKAGLKKAEIEAKTSIEKAVAEGNADAIKLKSEWENKAVDQLSSSWKDEFITFVVLSPCILIFFPSFQPFVRMGFDILGTLPEWYINLIYITVCAGLGLKGVGGISKFMRKK